MWIADPEKPQRVYAEEDVSDETYYELVETLAPGGGPDTINIVDAGSTGFGFTSESQPQTPAKTPCEVAKELLNDSLVRAELEAAHTRSEPINVEKMHEEGGGIFREIMESPLADIKGFDPFLSYLSFQQAKGKSIPQRIADGATGDKVSLYMDPGEIMPALIKGPRLALAWYHTHPARPGRENPYRPGETFDSSKISAGDIALSRKTGIPGLYVYKEGDEFKFGAFDGKGPCQ
jgi:hypothetical protein